MQKNISPWIEELDRERIRATLRAHMTGEVAIVGGGIAGMTTAYYLLKETKKHITLLEADKIAHGASGHNGGQAVDYFERPFSDIAQEFGLKMASEGQIAIQSSWQLLKGILRTTKIKVPFDTFIGYAGCTNIAQLEQHLKTKLLKIKGGVKVYPTYVANTAILPAHFYKKYRAIFQIVTPPKIRKLLETENADYIAALSSRKGCLNSALFVEKLAEYLQLHYPNRFLLLEHTPVKHVQLSKDIIYLHTQRYHYLCEKVVLCTNGFEHFSITSDTVSGMNRRFHRMISGLVGYMAGYLEPRTKKPTAISYFPKKNAGQADDPYVYMTRRNVEKNKSLICIGGPQRLYDHDTRYSRHYAYSQKATKEIQKFLADTLPKGAKYPKQFDYHWHGIMGYTPNNLRCVGPDIADTRLLYNLGCNGIGLLPSIYGAQKVSWFVQEKRLPKSIFDSRYQFKTHYVPEYA